MIFSIIHASVFYLFENKNKIENNLNQIIDRYSFPIQL